MLISATTTYYKIFLFWVKDIKNDEPLYQKTKTKKTQQKENCFLTQSRESKFKQFIYLEFNSN